MNKITLNGIEISVNAESVSPTRNGVILTGVAVRIELPAAAHRFYRHGWQSWSLTAWLDPTPLPIPKPIRFHSMQGDPRYAIHTIPNGSWLGAVDFSDGNVLLLGALNLESHVALKEQVLEGWIESGQGDWFVAYGDEQASFNQYAQMLGERLGKGKIQEQYRVWCSWYSLYNTIDEALLYKIFDNLDGLPFDVLQVDDGWQVSSGDWTANNKFPSGMTALADKIKSTGRKAGLWLAPFIATKSSPLFRGHPDWFLRDDEGKHISAGFNWGEQLFALDTTHPAALAWLAALMKRVRAWGFDYLKLDFLYAGALPGKRYTDMPREAAYRHGLKTMRAAMGDDAYFLTCGAPIIPSLGLCDAIRIGPDVAGEWENERDGRLLDNHATPATRNAIRTTVHRLWLSPLVHIDPDVVYFRSIQTRLTSEQKALLQDLAQICRFKATSDLPQWLTPTERNQLRAFLEESPDIQQTGPYTFAIGARSVDFSAVMPLPAPVRGFDLVIAYITAWLGGQDWALNLLDKIGKNALKKVRESLRDK